VGAAGEVALDVAFEGVFVDDDGFGGRRGWGGGGAAASGGGGLVVVAEDEGEAFAVGGPVVGGDAGFAFGELAGLAAELAVEEPELSAFGFAGAAGEEGDVAAVRAPLGGGLTVRAVGELVAERAIPLGEPEVGLPLFGDGIGGGDRVEDPLTIRGDLRGGDLVSAEEVVDLDGALGVSERRGEGDGGEEREGVAHGDGPQLDGAAETGPEASADQKRALKRRGSVAWAWARF